MRMTWLMVATLISTAAIGGSAMGQPAAEKPGAHEMVEVFAPYVVRREPVRPRRGFNREHLEIISVSRAVSFADLDLAKAEDRTILDSRVKQAAIDACKELDRRYPKQAYVPVPIEQDCVKNATDEAMIQVNELIAAAAAN